MFTVFMRIWMRKNLIKLHLQSAALSASVDLVATPALLGIAQIIKRSVLTGAKEKLSGQIQLKNL
jgi:hypothetical protein